MVASLVANVLALAGVLFSMQVYDRVIPAESLPTLYVLFGGVVLALVFDFSMRLLLAKVTDLLGKRADLRVSDLVYGHALRLRNSVRPKSTGSFISQLRELESIRDLITSSTATALADLPFFLLFLLVFWLIGGVLVFIPLVALLAMVCRVARAAAPGTAGQCLDARVGAAQRHAGREHPGPGRDQGTAGRGTLRAAVEPVQRRLRAHQPAPAHPHQRPGDLDAERAQGAVFAVVIVIGAPMVIAGDLTTGSLVAASMLSSRMMAPLAQLTHVLTRWQQPR
jgi:ATP-binding cassette subfamily C protein LapB